MEQKIETIYPSASFENTNHDLQRKIEKRLSDVSTFNYHINNI